MSSFQIKFKFKRRTMKKMRSKNRSGSEKVEIIKEEKKIEFSKQKKATSFVIQIKV